MTQDQTRANGVGSPSKGQQWLTAMLRAFVVLVHSVVSTFQMNRNRPPRDWHTDQADAALPRTKNDTQSKETSLAIPQDGSQALILSSAANAARPSKDERVLTALTPKGTPPLGKGRSAFRRSRNPGGDHFVPHPLTNQTPTQILTASESDLPLPGGGEIARVITSAPKTNAAA